DEGEHTTPSPYSVPSVTSSKSTSPLVAPSENSAFSVYRKGLPPPTASPDGDSTVSSRRPLHRRAPPQSRILTPRVRRAQLHLDNRSESNLGGRLGEEKKRSNSAGNGLDDDTSSSSSSPSPSPSPVKETRKARNFHKILNRFQNASDASNSGRPNRRITMGSVRIDGSSASPSISRRSSLHGNSPSRTNSARSEGRGRAAVPSPISHYLPESSVRPVSLSSHRSPPPPPLLSDSPFSQESLPPVNSIPISISIPNGTNSSHNLPRRRSLPAHWVKETDIDDPNSFAFPPISSPEDTRTAPITFIKPTPMVGAMRETFEKKSMMTGNCRRLTDNHQHSIQNGRRSKSREDHLHEMNGLDSLRHEGSLVSRSSFSLSPGVTIQRAKAVENSYSQMCSGTVSTLSWVAEKLSERSRKEEMIMRGPFSAFTFHNLHMHRNPVLIKGNSFFFDASFIKERKEHDVTVMISPHSHYAPVIRRGLGVSTYGEIEDIDGAIAKFLREHMEDDPPALKVVIMPRMKLCSLHALAAQNLHRSMDAEQFEAHISFVLIRLLSALKHLQTDGIDSLSTNFREFLLVYRTWNKSNDVPQLLFLPDALESSEDSECEQVGLCRYALRALCTLLHHRIDGEVPRILDQTRHSRALLAAAKNLHSDKSNSLSMSKQLLELSLWGAGAAVEGDFEAKLWMDSRRAECVNQLLRALMEDHSGWEEREGLRVEFLLSTTPRSLSTAHSILTSTRFE
ncbi:hypothetical protein PMAYCL1PPCAC_29035, partial [Pristionchus mayeri]